MEEEKIKELTEEEIKRIGESVFSHLPFYIIKEAKRPLRENEIVEISKIIMKKLKEVVE
jgi:hypothetical protein